MNCHCFCISRAVGAGGEEVGRKVAELTGYRYVDDEVLQLAATRGAVDLSAVSDVEARKSLWARLLESATPTTMAPEAFAHVAAQPPSDEMRKLIREAIVDTAEQGRVVIVAHAASHALGDADGVVRLLVTGSEQGRWKRLVDEEGVADDDANRLISEGDAARADYLKRFYDIAEAPEQYDLVINTDRISPAAAAGLVVAAAEITPAGR